MSTRSIFPSEPTSTLNRADSAHADFAIRSTVREFALGLASLKLTVWLIAMSIFLVLAGTLAQVEKGIWQVVNEYFRSFFVWIDFQLFAPPAFFPDGPHLEGGFLFPGGWTLGILLSTNLIAAHVSRFRIQATGKRRFIGFSLLALGVFITWQVIVGGAGADGLQAQPSFGWTALWNLFLFGWGVTSVGLLFTGACLRVEQRKLRRFLVMAGITMLLILIWQLAQGEAGRLDDSSMRILWQLAKGTAAGIVLLAGCVVLFQRRAGVVLLHGGIGLLMFNELLVGLTAVESRMHISEGQTVNYVQDVRKLELAMVDSSNPDEDDVVVVPQSCLLDGRVIRDEQLPFDISVDGYLENAVLSPFQSGSPNPATAGLGLQWIAKEVRPVSGTNSAGEINQSAAYLTFLDKQSGERLGTHLVSLLQTSMELPEKVTALDKPYKVYLRFKRAYKPYTLTLTDVRKDDYLGTDTPRNYSSKIHLVDDSRGVDRDVRIWMNNPLRFSGETFYQSGYYRDPQSGIESTTLQVVTNTGWMIPYVACMIVATGLLTHFLIALARFLRRRERQLSEPNSDEAKGSSPLINPPQTRTQGKAWIIPVCVVLASAGWLFSKARVPTAGDGEFMLYKFGKLPVVYQGRAKPLDTLARNSLRILSGRQTFNDANHQRQPATRWLLDVMTNPTAAAQHEIFRIENPEVLELLRLEARSGFRYAFSELKPHVENVARQAELARTLDPARLTVFHKKVLEVEQKLNLYDLLLKSCTRPVIRDDAELAAVDIHVATLKQQQLAKSSPPLMIPPLAEDGKWSTYAATALDAVGREEASANPFLTKMDEIRDAYTAGDTARFNGAVAEYQGLYFPQRAEGVALTKIEFEAFFNHAEPFYHALVMYLVAFVLMAISWLVWKRPLSRSAFWLIVVAFSVHTLALTSRIYISGRPPVTNLYSSAVFIGWGCVLLGIILELSNRAGMGILISPIAGFATLLIAHFLAADGDTIAVMQAVLDTQFWLATHVVSITLGYATTYVAGLLGILYIIRGVFTPTLKPSIGQEIARMIYGTLCFATFFSFIGTVLGGLWADDSWGRFWGWDPKENGALMIVLWNALVLHARWGGMIGHRGMAVLAVAGNIVVSWSWFGVNELGVGLHSYGFTEGVLMMLALFAGSQLLIIATGSLPQKWWWSARRHQAYLTTT